MSAEKLFWLNVALEKIPGVRETHKFGTNDAVGVSYVPVCRGGIYQTPTAATSLEILSSDANDTSAGTGAQQVTVIGLDANWVEQTEVVSMNGVSAVALSNQFTRVYRMFVSRTGTYATASAGSHAGTITLRVASAGATWATIFLTGFPRGQSQIGAYTVPKHKTAFVYPHIISGDGARAFDVVLFQRPNCDDVTTPFSAMRVVSEYVGLSGVNSFGDEATPLGPFDGPCDIGYMAQYTSGGSAGSVSVEYEIILLDSNRSLPRNDREF